MSDSTDDADSTNRTMIAAVRGHIEEWVEILNLFLNDQNRDDLVATN